jgi:glyoxylase-like metal-dependent hydrolase (beta-lactamase superfamily II)
MFGTKSGIELLNPPVSCARAFDFDGLLQPGQTLRLAGSDWQVMAAPGHDPHSVILFEPATEFLISADALWAEWFWCGVSWS